ALDPGLDGIVFLDIGNLQPDAETGVARAKFVQHPRSKRVRFGYQDLLRSAKGLLAGDSRIRPRDDLIAVIVGVARPKDIFSPKGMINSKIVLILVHGTARRN